MECLFYLSNDSRNISSCIASLAALDYQKVRYKQIHLSFFSQKNKTTQEKCVQGIVAYIL